MKKLISLVLVMTIVMSVFMGLGFSVAAEDAEVLNVTVDGVTTQVPVGEKFTYYYTLSNLSILNTEARVNYDSSKLQVTVADDTDEEVYDAYLKQTFPVVYNSSPILNADLTDKILYNFSSVKAKTFAENTILTAFEFTVLEAGDVTISTDIIEMADSNKEFIVDKTPTGSQVLKDFTYSEYVTYVAPEIPTEEPTEEATPDQPTQAPTEAPTQAETEAPTEAPKPIKVENIQTNPSDTNMGFTWDEVEGGFKYWVYKYNAETDTWASAASAYEGSAVVKLLSADTEYQFKVICKFEDGTMMKLADADIITARTLKAVATDSISGVADVVDATITWTEVEGATKYWVYKATSESGPFYIYNSAYTNSLVVRRLRPDTDYYFKVTALTYNNGIPTISDVNASPTVHVRTGAATQITTTLTGRTASTASISWPQFKNADKYWIKLSSTTKDTADTAAWSTIKSTTDISNLTYTFAGLEKCKTYYLTVTARYYEDDGNPVMVDYIPVEVKTLYSDSEFLTFTKVDDTTLTVAWPEDTNAQKTWVYVYDANGEMVVRMSSTTTSATIGNLADMENYTYGLYILDNDGKYGYITPDGGEKYHN